MSLYEVLVGVWLACGYGVFCLLGIALLKATVLMLILPCIFVMVQCFLVLLA